MTLNPSTQTQVAEKSILDVNGRQTYLGNSWIFPLNGIYLNSSSETPLILVKNPKGSGKSLFLFQRKIASTDTTFFKFYGSPAEITNIGSPGFISNLRTGSLQQTVSNSYISPNVPAAVAKVVTLTVFHTGSYYDVVGSAKAIQLYNSPSIGFYLWFFVSDGAHVQTDPGLVGTAVKITVASADSANTIATNVYNAINALTGQFTATNTPAGTVTVTNYTAGDNSAADSVVGTPCVLTNVTSGTNIGNATYLATLASQVLIEVVSDLIFVLDPGSEFLVTATCPSAASDNLVLTFLEVVWYEM